MLDNWVLTIYRTMVTKARNVHKREPEKEGALGKQGAIVTSSIGEINS